MKRKSWPELGRSAGLEVAHAQVARLRDAEDAVHRDIALEEARRGRLNETGGAILISHHGGPLDGDAALKPRAAVVADVKGIRTVLRGAVIRQVAVADHQQGFLGRGV